MTLLCSLPLRTASSFPDWEASKEKNMSLREGLATALPAVAPLNAFPFCLPQEKSPTLCQREGTEGRECKYFSPAKLKPTFAKIGGGIDLAMLVATPHRKLFP